MGYSEQEYVGKFIGDFHLDNDVVNSILKKLTNFETVNATPARLLRKDGSTAYVMINSNVFKDKRGGFEHLAALRRRLGRRRSRPCGIDDSRQDTTRRSPCPARRRP